MKYNVRVRIVDAFQHGILETQEYEADTGLAAMHKAQADEKNTSRGVVSTTGADPLPFDPVTNNPDGPPKKAKKAKKPKKPKVTRPLQDAPEMHRVETTD